MSNKYLSPQPYSDQTRFIYSTYWSCDQIVIRCKTLKLCHHQLQGRQFCCEKHEKHRDLKKARINKCKCDF